MGAMQAQGYAEAVAEGAVSLTSAINAHRISNLFPVPPAHMTAVMIEAVEAARAEEYEKDIQLPDGVLYKGQTWVYPHEVIEEFRLGAFL